MKPIGLFLLIVGVTLVAAPAHAADAAKTSFTLKGHTDGASNYWTEGDGTVKNPVLEIPASTQITVTVSSVSGTHTFQAGSKEATAPLTEVDDAITYTFTSPASGNVDYKCTIHPDMKGQFHVAGTAAEPAKKAPGTQVAGVMIALVGAALLVARRSK
jgi:plastocyanin